MLFLVATKYIKKKRSILVIMEDLLTKYAAVDDVKNLSLVYDILARDSWHEKMVTDTKE